MSSSQGNGGRTSSATLPTFNIPAGFTADASRTVTHKGRQAVPFNGLSDALLASLILGVGGFTHTSETVSRDATLQKTARQWCADNGALCGIGAPVKHGDTITRTVWAYFADAIPENRKEEFAGLKAALEEQIAKMNAETPVNA
jgi:hypothetical protein